MADYSVPGRDEIAVGRLRKKVAKLTAQRDHWKAEHDKLLDALNKLPVYVNAIRRLDEARAREEDTKQMRQRCKEQAMLIEKLTKDAKP